MLKELKISNFRGFGNEIKVRFAPITVLIGRNNAGKSSIIKFLLMLQQSLETGSAGFLAATNGRVDLGKFSDLQNTVTREKCLHFALTVEEDSSLPSEVQQYILLKGGGPTEKARYVTEATVLYKDDAESFQGENHKFMVMSGEKEILKRSARILPDSALLKFADEQQNESSEKDGDAAAVNAEKECIDNLRSQIKALRHMLPVRGAALSRTFGAEKPERSNDVGRDGRHTMHYLKNCMVSWIRREHLFGSTWGKCWEFATSSFARRSKTHCNVLRQMKRPVQQSIFLTLALA